MASNRFPLQGLTCLRPASARRLLPFALLLAGLLGCTKAAYYQVYVPPAANVAGIDRVAIADFDGLQRSGRIIAAKLSEGIVDAGQFQLLERDKLDRILAERDFNQSGYVDPATVSDLKLLGVDALIFGVVDAYSVDQQTGITKVETEVGTGKYREVQREGEKGETETVREEIKKTVLIDRGYVLREGTVAVTFRMANINTGEIVAIKTETANFSKKAWRGETNQLPSKDAILDDLASTVTARFLHQIHPSTITRRVTFEENDVPSTKVGISYAQAGLWDKAYDAMSQAVRDAPWDPTAHFNLAVVCDVLGKSQEAMASIERAIELDPKDKYLHWLAQVRQREMNTARL
jgi:tetratricopeptide (TPR) repeat protein